jgi:hypothetical protein
MPGRRVVRDIRRALAELELDLSGATVLTEAATGPFAATAVIASLAGAESVHAVARPSRHGSVEEAHAQVMRLAGSAGADRIELHRRRDEVPAGIDVLTNLRAVRPVDRELLPLLSEHGAVSLMYEAWEARPGEIDLAACAELGVPVAGVSEDFQGLAIFQSVGPLALKLCFEAGLEVARNRILVVGDGRFPDVIARSLSSALADVERLATSAELDPERVRAADALLVADYAAHGHVLGGARGPSPQQLAEWNDAITVVQVVGPSDVAALARAGIPVHPERQLEPREMAVTLAHLGPRPVIDLHAAGLKVGEVLWRERREARPAGRWEGLVQRIA